MSCAYCKGTYLVSTRSVTYFRRNQRCTFEYDCCERCFEKMGGYCDHCGNDRELFATQEIDERGLASGYFKVHPACLSCCEKVARRMNNERALSLLAFAEKELPRAYQAFFNQLASLPSAPQSPEEPWRAPLFGICLDAAMLRKTPEELVADLAWHDGGVRAITYQPNNT